MYLFDNQIDIKKKTKNQLLGIFSEMKYISQIQSQQTAINDRSGNSLCTSGDNEIVIQILLNNYQVGFFPQLNLKHLIPEERLTKSYLGKLNEGIMQSWTQFLIKYNI